MSENTTEKKERRQMLVKETFQDTKSFFHKAFRNVRSLLLKGYAKLPRNGFINPIFSGSSKIGPKVQETDSSCRSSSQHWDPGEIVKKKANGDEASSSVSDHSQLEDREEKKARKQLQGEEHFLATEKFAKKMEELEMMNVNDGNHATDIDEVVRCYSLLTSPAYLDIVDKFSKDVYRELNLPRSLRDIDSSMARLDSTSIRGSLRRSGSARFNGSTRNLGSASVHSSMRRLGCSTSVHTLVGKVGTENAHNSMRKLTSTIDSKRKLGSDSIHGSGRRLGAESIHGSMRRFGSDSVHGSMRQLGSDSIHGSMRKLGSDSIHGSVKKLGSESMRNLGSNNIHGSMRKLSSDSIHGPTRRLGSDSIQESTRKLGPDSIHGSMRILSSDSVHGSMRKLGSKSIHGSMRKLNSDSIYSSMRCMPSKAVYS